MKTLEEWYVALSSMHTVVPSTTRSLICAVRSSIKDEYTKRLAKLAKMAIGKDEIRYVGSIHPPLDF